MMSSPRHRLRALIASSALVLAPPASIAGDLNAEVDDMFNNLGTIGNYTEPGAFKGQTFNTYTGGSLYLRSPNKTYQLTAIAFPSAKAGCGGIDVFGGSFSHISADEFKNMLKNITAALPGIAFQLALESVSPMLGGLSKWAKGLETSINNARIGSCETATALVSSAAEAAGYSAQEACAKLAVQLGLETDADAARRRCARDRPGVMASARGSGDPGIQALAPFVGNLTWQALKTVSTLDDPARELVMSMLGTVIFYPDEAGRDPDPIAPTITKVTHLLYGQSDAGNGNVMVQLLKCNNYADCDVVTAPPNYVHVPFTKKVEELMRSISDKIATRTPIPNDSPEVGFVNRTSEPVWRMLSVGNTIPGSGLAESMIVNYREIIAADYAYNFIDQYMRIGANALEKQWRLDEVQREKARDLRARAANIMAQLGQEKNTLYAKKTSIASMAMYLEQLERQLRTTMPQHVIDMLGQGSVATR
jgi:conjugative transfer pilus assembly protein TraH